MPHLYMGTKSLEKTHWAIFTVEWTIGLQVADGGKYRALL